MSGRSARLKLAAGRIADFQCPKDKTRAYLWCDEVKGLGIIATAAGAKSYIFQAKVKGKSMRLTIGDVGAWSITKAQAEARRLQTLITLGTASRLPRAFGNCASTTGHRLSRVLRQNRGKAALDSGRR